MIIKHYLARFFLPFLALLSFCTLQASRESTTTQTSVSFSPKTRALTVEDLSINTMLTIIHENINQALINFSDVQNSSSLSDDLDTLQQQDQQKQVLVALQKFFDETTSLLSYIVHSVINTGVFKYNPDIEYKFINTYSCIDLSEPVQPRHLRLLKNNIQNLNEYISNYCLTRKNHLSEQETVAFGAITKLNNSMLDCILKDEFMGIDYWDRLIDNCFYRPLEWVGANKRFFLFVSAVTIALIVYYYWSKKRSFLNNNTKFDVVQFEVTDQNGNVCAYHAFYNVGTLLAENDLDVLKEKLQDKSALKKLLPVNRADYELDAQDVEERLLNKNPLRFSDHTLNRMVVIPCMDPLVNVRDHDALITQLDETTPGRNFLVQLNTFKNSGKGEKIGFIINTGHQGRRNGDLVDTTYQLSHWIGAVFTKDPNAKSGLSVAVADSINRNVTDHPAVSLIAEKLLS